MYLTEQQQALANLHEDYMNGLLSDAEYQAAFERLTPRPPRQAPTPAPHRRSITQAFYIGLLLVALVVVVASYVVLS